ncbi:MAG: CvpA family protein [Oscillospiraceae bacterium]|jgi:hypothetical protein|nr:CvpA family protein [Ruminococcaceae bacterium BL-4]
MKKPLTKNGKKAVAVIVILILAFIYYYVELPAINIHSVGFWEFLILAAVVIVFILTILPKLKHSSKANPPDLSPKHDKRLKKGLLCIGFLVVVFLLGALLSSPIVNASKYQQLLTVQDREFTNDIKQISYDEIPLLDSDSAALLGNRKMGSMVDMVSQFEVSNTYTQINYHNSPVRVAPLQYADPIKWLTNQSNGIPAYILIDMATQDTELVKLDQPIKYSESEYFNRNIYRHLRFHYPTYIFDNINFELDENGTPWWVCPVKGFTIGLFGGQTVERVVLCNAQTGECQDVSVGDVPQWVDRVYSSSLLTSYYNYYGTLKHGFLNSVFGQKDCLKTTDGYNYLALDDDVWLYTGVTSVTGDQSIVGFVLMNQRTGETHFYSVQGAVESSAMSSAEGQVQNLGYKATFPLLLNTADQPTYFIALKDNSGLVKKYAMVNVQKYQIVAIGDTVAECEKKYISLMAQNGISGGTVNTTLNDKKITGTIRKMAQSVLEGNSHYYLLLDSSSSLFDVPVSQDLNVLRYSEGDRITLTYTPPEDGSANGVCTVTGIVKDSAGSSNPSSTATTSSTASATESTSSTAK